MVKATVEIHIPPNLLKMNENAKKAVSKAVIEAAAFLSGDVKASIAGQRDLPRTVDTGLLMRSVSYNRINEFAAEVGTNVYYAPYIELGTKYLRARPHFRDRANKNKDKVKNFIVDELKKTI